MSRIAGLSPSQFHGVHLNDIASVEYLLVFNSLLYDIDNVKGNNIAELVRRSVQKHENALILQTDEIQYS